MQCVDEFYAYLNLLSQRLEDALSTAASSFLSGLSCCLEQSVAYLLLFSSQKLSEVLIIAHIPLVMEQQNN
jgi:hypothetical protein